jgi:hypothetical protein
MYSNILTMSLPVVVEGVAVVLDVVIVDGSVVVIVELASGCVDVLLVVLLVVIIVVDVVFSLCPSTKIKAPINKTYNNHTLILLHTA